MIEGLRLLPWVHYEREQQKRNGNPEWKAWLDCDECLEQNSERVRGAYHCAYLPRRLWTGYGFMPPRDWPPRLQKDPEETQTQYYRRCRALACPGYAIRLPQVIETALLFRWFDKGSLRDAMGGRPVTDALRQALDVFSGEIAAVDAARMEVNSGD